MLFNSLTFLFFFPLTTIAYFLLPHRVRWLHLLACSCLFYAAFVPSYLLILLALIVIDYSAGLLISRADGGWRRFFLIVSVVANLGLLGVFKYFDFAAGNLNALAAIFHWPLSVPSLGMWLPIGLSFHTFQSMAYTIDVYRRRQSPEKHFGIYALYVMFYPQLVAGPIERPEHMLHQFRQRHDLNADRIFDGLKLMLWGLFKKIVIADRLSMVVDAIYANPKYYGGMYLILATWLFAIQIYCDFSGYTDMAIGAANVLGFQLMQNFDRPYTSQSVAEFWRRWHISLSGWFRDYLYIPLGGSRVSVQRWCANVTIVFLLSGLWHGANWTFAIWGALHGGFLIAERLTQSARARIAVASGAAAFPNLLALARVFTTFNLVAFAWIFFRADSVSSAARIVSGIFTARGFWHADDLKIGASDVRVFSSSDILLSLGLVIGLLAGEWLQARSALEKPLDMLPIALRWPAYYAMIVAILWIGALGGRSFIYFQF